MDLGAGKIWSEKYGIAKKSLLLFFIFYFLKKAMGVFGLRMIIIKMNPGILKLTAPSRV